MTSLTWNCNAAVLLHFVCYAVLVLKRRIGEVTERFKNEQSSFSNLSITSPTSQFILQPFHRFTYITAHSPTLPLLDLRHSSFSKPSFASPTSQALHLRHLANHPWQSLKIMLCNNRRTLA